MYVNIKHVGGEKRKKINKPGVSGRVFRNTSSRPIGFKNYLSQTIKRLGRVFGHGSGEVI